MKIDISLPKDKKPFIVELEEEYVNGFCTYMGIGTRNLGILLGHIIRPVVEKLIEEAANK